MTETRSVSVSLVFRPDDIITGRPVWPGDTSLRVRSDNGFLIPTAKDDGHFVFTGPCPEALRITSGLYESVILPVKTPGFLRAALIPRTPRGTLLPLECGEGECLHIGFLDSRGGYALSTALEAGGSEVTLYKEDYAELAGLRHVLISPDGTGICTDILSGRGNGCYLLASPSPAAFPVRTRLLPLAMITGNGSLRVPVPPGAQAAYILRGGELSRLSLDE